MRNTIFISWAKNVNKQRTYDSINGGFSSTASQFFMLVSKKGGVKLVLIQVILRFLNTGLSTFKKAISHLLYISFPRYPQRLLLEPLNKI